ncbi:MAG: hypothetical protein KAI29_14325, partial [Cyclobacteriaceae bacterium]|nr:hypothetical protein [Cyclobacteriaceae bacterium]
ATQIPSAEIAGIADAAGEAVDVFSFKINDDPTASGLDVSPTNVSKLWIKNPQPTTDWANIIGGVTLSGKTLGNIPILNISIKTDSIVIDIAPKNLIIPDKGSEEITMGVYLQSSGIVDGTNLQFEISETVASQVFKTSVYGSQFTSPFTSSTILSNIHSINVSADRLTIISYSPTVDGTNKSISLEVEATDENGNIDTNENTPVTIELGQNLNSGTLSTFNTPGLTQQLVSGTISWTNIRYSEVDIITLITSSTTLDNDITGTIIIGNPLDLIVNSDVTLSSDVLSVRNVIINDGATLTMTSGITVNLTGDFTFNGTGALNDLGATTRFIATGNNDTQTISKPDATTSERFYNMEIDQGQNANGVYNEMTLELENTLTLTNGTFYIDGAANDQSFTLLSSSDNTARIGPIGSGFVLAGNITTQRFIKEGT